MRNQDGLARLLEMDALAIPAPPPPEMTAADMEDKVSEDWVPVYTLECKECCGPAFRHPQGNLLLGCPTPTCNFTIRAFAKQDKFKEVQAARI